MAIGSKTENMAIGKQTSDANNKKLVICNHNIRHKAVNTSYRPEKIINGSKTVKDGHRFQNCKRWPSESKQVTQTTKS